MTRLKAFVVAICCAAAGGNAIAATELDYRVDAATQILQDLQRIPENAIPPALLSRAYAVAVIPSVVKAGFVLAGAYGRGIVVARRQPSIARQDAARSVLAKLNAVVDSITRDEALAELWARGS